MRHTRMISKLAALFTVAVWTAQAYAGTAKIEAVVAEDQNSKPADTFPSDVPKLYAFFRTSGTKKGDNVRGVWIAEDVGNAAPNNTKIDETTLSADKDDFYGAFSLSEPTKGWPVGHYRVEFYLGSELVTTVKFAITSAKTEER